MNINVTYISEPANPFEVRRPIELAFDMGARPLKLNLTIEEAYQLRYALDGALSVAMDRESSGWNLTPFETVR